MSRSIKKGPFVQEALYKKVVAMNEAGEKEGSQNLEQNLNYFP